MPDTPQSDSACAVPGTDLVRQSAILERITAALWIYDIDHCRVIWANEAGLAVWAAESLEELRARDLGRGMASAVARRLRQYREDFCRKDARFCDLWTLYPGGRPTPLTLHLSGYRLADGRMAMLCEAQENDARTPDMRRSTDVLLHTKLMISIVDAQTDDVLYLNPAARTAFGQKADCFRERFARSGDYAQLLKNAKETGDGNGIARIHTEQGLRWHEVTVSTCLDPVTGRPALVVSETDVSDLREAEERARRAAYVDALTGLPNRLALTAIMSRMIAHAEKRGSEFGVIFIDIDQFKTVNDLLGHTSGDRLLCEIADRLRAIARRGDSIIRLGGDEFLFLAPRRSGTAQTMPVLANEILSLLSITVPFGERAMTLTPSIGVALYPEHARSEPALMQYADLAMSEAKASGRNALRLFTPSMHLAFEARETMLADLRVSMEENHFEVYYQPRVSTADLSIVGAEALLRWKHPRRGMVSPATFIPICEESGLIRGLGLFVLSSALRELNRWHKAGHRIAVSVNVSQRQLADPDFAALVEDVLAESESPGHFLELELTETMILEETAAIQANMTRIRRTGVRLSLDDFGTGYSNLARLRQVEIDCLKIDRSLIKTLPENAAVTSMIVAMARLMNVKVVAEGVETPEQVAWVRDAHCQEMQGFYFARPMPAAEFAALLSQERTRTKSNSAA
ncbi:hypothetical protein BTR14_13645 [Rhizobium rhizosphaerae]|uniref:Uncharacterized protein n=1 Tax=Xaviernesmea rhizosphaerae TaxID=1672749 RepID=A0ABX3PBM5_9HYPH|nr:EAL domain-containing protein [Xaviernesmea rhizosphaerae]OQP85820.1 hypothetical protein BTR14_13645 [Xaviernesmea rhizosphaerae]